MSVPTGNVAPTVSPSAPASAGPADAVQAPPSPPVTDAQTAWQRTPEGFYREMPEGWTPPAAGSPESALGTPPDRVADQPAADDPQAALRSQLESEFESRRAGLQSTYDRKLEAANRQLVSSLDETIQLRAQNAAMRQWFDEYAKNNRLDQGVLAQFQLAGVQGQQRGQAYARTVHASISEWEGHNRMRHEQELARASNNGQLFNMQDPEISKAFDDFLEAGRVAGRSGSQNPRATQEAERRFAIVQGLMQQRRESGLAQSPTQPMTYAAPVPGSPADNRQRASERGEQLLGTQLGSGSGAVTQEDLLAEAHRLVPGLDAKAKEERYLAFLRLQRQHGFR